MIRKAVAKIRVDFIDGSDRAVLRMCAGYTGNDGCSSGSDIQTRSVELKCDGCKDHSGFFTSAEIAGGRNYSGHRTCDQASSAARIDSRLILPIASGLWRDRCPGVRYRGVFGGLRMLF